MPTIRVNPVYIGRTHMLAYITIPDERYQIEYERIFGNWSIRIGEVDIEKNLDLVRRGLDLLVDMAFPRRFVVQKFVADMARLQKDFGFGYQLHEKYRFALLYFGSFAKRFRELYKGGTEIKRLDEYKKSYFDRI
jgi:hypothetical protein